MRTNATSCQSINSIPTTHKELRTMASYSWQSDLQLFVAISVPMSTASQPRKEATYAACTCTIVRVASNQSTGTRLLWCPAKVL